MMKKYKQIDLECEDLTVKAHDSGKVEVKGYFADFHQVDSDGDRIKRGAFAKSLKENKSRIMHLLQHNAYQPLARPETLLEDEKGLHFHSVFSKEQMKVGYIHDTAMLYKSGVYKEHSVGFVIVKQENEDKHNLITEGMLLEGSTVTWGANSDTPVTDVKNMTPEELTSVKKRFRKLRDILKNSSLTDETYICVETEIKQLEALVSIEPHEEGTQKNNEPQEWLTFMELIKV